METNWLQHKIAIIGGTGKEGKGLALRWAKAGHQVIIGSRSIEKAQAAVEEVKKMLSVPCNVTAKLNAEAVADCTIAVLTVPFAAHRETLEALKDALKGKILIDVTVPLVPPQVTKVQMPPAGSAAMEAKTIVGENVEVVSAFQNISYENLLEQNEVDCDVLVCGETKEAREVVLQLVRDTGLVGWDAGPIENSVVVEGLTSILIGINKKHGVKSSGIRITGVPRQD